MINDPVIPPEKLKNIRGVGDLIKFVKKEEDDQDPELTDERVATEMYQKTQLIDLLILILIALGKIKKL